MSGLISESKIEDYAAKYETSAGGTSVVQKIVIAAHSVEELVGRRLEWKLRNLAEFGNSIGDADLQRN